MNTIPESDWKYMRALKQTLLERMCERINQETANIINDSKKSAHERCLDIFEKTRRDKMEVVSAFDDWRRSTIFSKIIDIYRQGLFTDRDLQGLTQQTRERIDAYMPIK